MLRTKTLSRIALAALLSPMASIAWSATAYPGKYADARLTVELTPADKGYTGTMRLGEQTYPLTAQEADGHLRGTFQAGNKPYEFVADLKDDTLVLQSGTKTYNLKRVAEARAADAPNPLDGGAPAAGADAPATPADAPPGYTVINTTDAGKAIATKKKSASVETAVKATLPELATYFGSKVSIARAFEDNKDHQTGGATFTGTRQGAPVNGLIFCRIGDGGASVAVVYARANATQDDWKKLFATPAAPQKPGAPHAALTEYKFPDGTGSIGLAEGYTCNAQSAMGEVDIKGPSEQVITLGFTLTVSTPNSMMVRTQMQLEANARANGFRMPPRPQMFIAPFAGPVDTYGNLVPQISAVLKSKGLPQIKLTKLLSQDSAPAYLQGGKAAIANFLFDLQTPDGTQHRQAIARMEVTPISQDSFMFSFSGGSSPQEQFEKDRPVMLSITNSLKLNDQVIAAKTQQNINAQNQWFAAQQKQHQAQVDAFDAQNRAWEKRSLEQSRSNDDFDEIIRGYRTVQDTQTGEKTSVNLGYSDDIVNKLNEGSPGRYIQIPLRDEADPLPGR